MSDASKTSRKIFDKTDLLILQALQADASQTLDEIARHVKLAPSSVHERVRRLRQAGIIRRWTIEVDAATLGQEVLAYIGVSATRPCAELITDLEKIPEIEECHSVAGKLSMMLKVRVIKTEDLLRISDRLRQIPGIENTETTIVLRTQIQRNAPLAPN